MTTYARRNAQHESGEWVVDTATGRIVRRERPLPGRVKSVPSLGTLDGALAIEHAFADLRVFCLADEPQTVPDGRTLDGNPRRCLILSPATAPLPAP